MYRQTIFNPEIQTLSKYLNILCLKTSAVCLQRCLGNIGAFSALLLENQVMAFQLEIIKKENFWQKMCFKIENVNIRPNVCPKFMWNIRHWTFAGVWNSMVTDCLLTCDIFLKNIPPTIMLEAALLTFHFLAPPCFPSNIEAGAG